MFDGRRSKKTALSKNAALLTTIAAMKQRDADDLVSRLINFKKALRTIAYTDL
jgi:hypothetical protein